MDQGQTDELQSFGGWALQLEQTEGAWALRGTKKRCLL